VSSSEEAPSVVDELAQKLQELSLKPRDAGEIVLLIQEDEEEGLVHDDSDDDNEGSEVLGVSSPPSSSSTSSSSLKLVSNAYVKLSVEAMRKIGARIGDHVVIRVRKGDVSDNKDAVDGVWLIAAVQTSLSLDTPKQRRRTQSSPMIAYLPKAFRESIGLVAGDTIHVSTLRSFKV